ncbi:hypothetical protein KSD_76070 [Ktedonobacter sp. SOSP1-85]|uniref:Kelch repeat-containing protein n=1 Tax=Ktedonobacter sp. SOSP1-85 TaxID=2778367 RepID=UPI0019166966|nr:kelch repeat-containing protein [Ktedonobacter sp. SOSP1-85]GHO79836.1 hypothetical protein KSD_76070 [Ktedonobacter sp. SOSP1-85]
MSSSFAITAATSSVPLDSSRQVQTSFTVSNTTTRVISGRARVVALSSAASSWLTLLGESEREFASTGSQQYTVQITVPPGAPTGDYTFRLDMVDLANPDDDTSEGPTVKFTVPAAAPVKKPFPWWIVAAALGALILLGGAAYGLSQITRKAPAPIAMQPTVTPTVVAGQWKGAAPMPTAREGLVVVRGSDGRLYAIGGHGTNPNGSYYLTRVEIYDAAKNTWTTGTQMPTHRGYLAAVLGPDGLIYAIGGTNRVADSGNNQLSTVDTYDPLTDTWTTLASTLPTPRSNLTATVGADGRIYVIGGKLDSGELNVVEAYNVRTQTWTTLAPMPTARYGLASALGPDGRIYVMGGINASGILKTVEAYDPKTNTWTPLAPMPTARTGLTAVVGPDGRIYAIGGRNTSGPLKTVEAYDPRTNAWTNIAPMSTARDGLGGALGQDGRIYAIGGSAGSSVNTVEVYNNQPVAMHSMQVGEIYPHTEATIPQTGQERKRIIRGKDSSRP